MDDFSRPLAPLTLSERWYVFSRQPHIRIAFGAAVVALAIGYLIGNVFMGSSSKSQASPTSVSTTPLTSTTLKSSQAAVYVTGEVKSPGVIELTLNDRIIDAIDKAGGATANASMTNCNLAAKISDGMMITIPSSQTPTQNCIGGGSSSPSSAGSATSSTGNSGESGIINLNTASQSLLEELPGVGPKMAESIIAYREKSPFSSVNDLRKVKGIGDKRFADLKDLVTV